MERLIQATPLKMELVRQNVKQWRLASLVEISESEMSKYVSGRQRCPADMRHRIASILQVKVDILFPEEK